MILSKGISALFNITSSQLDLLGDVNAIIHTRAMSRFYAYNKKKIDGKLSIST